MDPSISFSETFNRLQFLLGEQGKPRTVKPKEISPEEWLVIIKAALSKLEPKLKLMHGFRPLDDLLDIRPEDSPGQRAHRKDLQYYCGRAQPETRVRGAESRKRTRVIVFSQVWIWQEPPEGPQLILLTQSGKWLGVSVEQHENVIKPLTDT